MDKDGLFLDNLDNEVHQAWKEGRITNTLRSLLLNEIQGIRDIL